MRIVSIARVALSLVAALLALQSLLLAAPVARAQSRTLYVAPFGADSNPGTLEAPFRTIQHCANTAAAGDSCLMRAGTYRETITPPRSGIAGNPIRFGAYNNEAVVVSGADPLVGWTRHSGNIYKTRMAWTMVVTPTSFANARPNAGDQIFVDGDMLIEARWPNIALGTQTALRRQDNVRAEGGWVVNSDEAVYVSSRLSSFRANYWQGGWINYMPGYGITANSCAVTGNITATVSLKCPQGETFKASDPYFRPNIGNPFFLWGKLEALDAPGEWFRAADGTLYLWAPDGLSPESHNVEAKRRLYAFDLSGRQHIDITGLSIFAASVKTSPTTSRVLLDALTMRYVWHFHNFRVPAWDDNGLYTMLDRAGVVLEGENITISNSDIAYSAASGVVLKGRGNRVVNTVIRDTGYMGASDAISAGSSDPAAKHRVEQNTLYSAGRIGVHLTGSAVDVIANDIYQTHLQAVDLGAVYGYAIDGQGSTIAYNLIHDATPEYSPTLRYWGAYGIYLDDDTYNFSLHHNIVWNTTNAGIGLMGNTGRTISPTLPYGIDGNRKVFNNTVDGQIWIDYKTRLVRPGDDVALTHRGTEFRNNLATRQRLFPSPITPLSTTTIISASNLIGSGHWIDRQRNNYQLRPGSPAIDGGAVLPPVTDGFLGTAPDIGALESGKTPFDAGALLRERDLNTLTISCTDDAAAKNADCFVEDMPIGRRAPNGFQIRIGTGPASNACANSMSYLTQLGTADCADVSYGSQQGLLPIFARLPGGEWVDTGATFAVGDVNVPPPAPSIRAILPNTGTPGGGTRITISGTNFSTATRSYRVPVTIANPAAAALTNYPVPVTLDTAQLIAQNKLRADCGDLRFNDQFSELDYWLEGGCNTPTTRLWVRLESLSAQGDTIFLTYGNSSLTSASSGAATFAFFDDFEDGAPSANLDLGGVPGVTVAETGGQMRIAGAPTEANQYDSVGFSINTSLVTLPPSFAIDSSLSAVEQPGDSFPKIGFGAADEIMMIFADYTSGGDRKVGYWGGTSWVAVGDSLLEAPTFANQRLSYASTADGTSYYFENGSLQAQRSGITNPNVGYFAYSPNAAGKSFDVRFDNLRVRNFVYPEPQTSLGAEQPPASSGSLSVMIGGVPCPNIIVARATSLTCVTPPHQPGPADVVVTNPDGQAATLPRGFTYLAPPNPGPDDLPPAAYLPVLLR
jgi:hypothetical protein